MAGKVNKEYIDCWGYQLDIPMVPTISHVHLDVVAVNLIPNAARLSRPGQTFVMHRARKAAEGPLQSRLSRLWAQNPVLQTLKK